MKRRLSIRHAVATTVVAASSFALGMGPAVADTATTTPSTVFYVPVPDKGAVKQIVSLVTKNQMKNAALIEEMVATPQAVWVNGGTTDAATTASVAATVKRATAHHQVPVFVLYNIPFRDCAQYSAGGASNATQYASWVRAVAKGLGSSRAYVMLEPDSLGIIPNYTPLGQTAKEWCQPTVTSGTVAKPVTKPAPGADPKHRFAELNDAVTVLKKLAGTKVYLDGTHSAWLNVADASDRLIKAGVAKADGFFLNMSNYQFTTNSVQYGNWISQCIAYTTEIKAGDFDQCGNQYWNGGPLDNFASGVALSNYGHWGDTASDPTLNTANINAHYAEIMGSVVPKAHFVVDTSRNGKGPWNFKAAGAKYPDNQDWCNPPARGLGIKPTTATGAPLADAFIWGKTPGQSDGSCNRGVAKSTTDPLWGKIVDPTAGAWFPQQALDLARRANPAMVSSGAF